MVAGKVQTNHHKGGVCLAIMSVFFKVETKFIVSAKNQDYIVNYTVREVEVKGNKAITVT